MISSIISILGEVGTRYGDSQDAHIQEGDTRTHVRASGMQGRAGRATGSWPSASSGPSRFWLELQLADGETFVQLEARGILVPDSRSPG